MTDHKDRRLFQFSDKDKEFSQSVHHWLAQYDEEDDFLCEKISSPLPEFTEDE